VRYFENQFPGVMSAIA